MLGAILTIVIPGASKTSGANCEHGRDLLEILGRNSALEDVPIRWTQASSASNIPFSLKGMGLLHMTDLPCRARGGSSLSQFNPSGRALALGCAS
jgi:hypothetical protein